MQDPAADHAHWHARLDLVLEPRGERTALVHKRQYGPLSVQRPFHPEGAPCHLYVLHPPGGVVGGDRLNIDLRVRAGAHALLTQPGAAKFYRSAGATARQRQVLRAAAGGVLEWLPQEMILFPGARLQADTTVALEPGARFFGWELSSLGRPVIGERFEPGRADLGLRIECDGRPLLLDRLRIDEGVGLDGPSGLRGLPVNGTLIATGADAEVLATARAVSAQWPALTVAATRLDDLLVVRGLASRVEPLMLCFRALWQELRPRLLGIRASPPRIWAT